MPTPWSTKNIPPTLVSPILDLGSVHMPTFHGENSGKKSIKKKMEKCDLNCFESQVGGFVQVIPLVTFFSELTNSYISISPQ